MDTNPQDNKGLRWQKCSDPNCTTCTLNQPDTTQVLTELVTKIRQEKKDTFCSLFEKFGYHGKDCWDDCWGAKNHNTAIDRCIALVEEQLKGKQERR